MASAWFHCFSGIAGDMALGSLVDAGADPDDVIAMCRRLDVDGWSLEFEPVLRGGIAATKAHVHVEETTVVRTASNIVAMIGDAGLPPRVEVRALRTFETLAEVEGQLHRVAPAQVHFHEIGAIDSIIDIVGTCAALELLGVDTVYASPVAVGRGMVRSAHGLIPNPSPAVVELLHDAPTYGIDTPIELTTPTGAALLAANVVEWGPLPPMTIGASGFGAGSRDIDGRVNAVQTIVGSTAGVRDRGQPVTLFETNVDDATGETLAHTISALLDAGAHDAWITPVLMKKGRPGHVVSVLCDLAISEQIAATLTRETGSFGVRAQRIERWPSARLVDQVDVDGQPIRVKVSPGRAKVEHDDAARAARTLHLPLREVVSRAEQAWRHTQDHDHGDGHDHADGHLHDHDHDH
jgi:pyridinium-3,5-bisthiocarboxylic acid mononucleotide nickel chelatase